MIKRFLRCVLKKLYRIEIKGLDNFYKAGDRVVVVANHLSFLDPILLALYLPGDPVFAVNSHISGRWYFKPFLKMVRFFSLDPTNPMSIKSMITEVKKDQVCVIFPEGRITVTGSLMKIYEGPGMIADKAKARVLPVRIDGAQYTPFSHLKGKVRIRWFPKITLTILEPKSFVIDPSVKGRERRHVASMKLYDLMSDMVFDSSDRHKTLFESLLDQVHLHGRKHVIAEDKRRSPISYGQFLMKTVAMGDSFSTQTQLKEHVGIMLPNSLECLISFFALQSCARIPAMIHFSAGIKSIILSCKTALIKTIYTSKKFAEKTGLLDLLEAMTSANITVHYLEDIAVSFSLSGKLKAWMRARFPGMVRRQLKAVLLSDSAVILFTSGSEGAPKGVVLSHENIQANRFQLASRIDLCPTDVVFNALPMFHSFGLTGGTLLPILSGIRTFFYPSPLHYRIIPELIYETNATIMFGADTFLSGYARFANSYDFYSVRYVFAGAEKLKEETRKLWMEKYGVRVFEGYGATEASPALSINTAMHNKPGTVGRLLPGIQYALKPVPGIAEGGRLLVKGPNVMKGYLLHDQPGVLLPPDESGYDTGDIVSFDEEAYLSIQGRAKRFAKIAGEMISLAVVENYLLALWPGKEHAVINVPDSNKGEALVLVTNHSEARRDLIIAYVREQGLRELSIPKKIQIVDSLPVLGSGKVDYVSLKASVLNVSL